MKRFKDLISRWVLVGAVLALAACSTDDSSNTTGNCTQTFLDRYNSVGLNLKDLKNAYKSTSYSDIQLRNKLEQVNASCHYFFKEYGNVSCKALVNYEAKTVSGNDFKKECDMAKSILSQNHQPSDENSSSKIERTESAFRAEDVKFLVLDPNLLGSVANSAGSDKDPKVIIKGYVTTASLAGSDIRMGKTFCMVSAENPQSWNLQNTAGRILTTKEINEVHKGDLQLIVFTLDDGTLNLTCAKTTKAEFALGELKEALGTILKIQITP